MTVKLENLENTTKEGIGQLKTTVQHSSANILPLETKLDHSKEDPVVELIEKVKPTKKKKLNCLSVINGNPNIQQQQNYTCIYGH